MQSILSQAATRELTLTQWRSLHLRLGLAAATIPLIFITPSLLNRSDRLQVAGRFIAPIVVVISGGIILKTAGEIETLEPLVDKIHAQKLALLNHGLNTETYQQTKFNTLHAGHSVLQLTDSLEPQQKPEVTPLLITKESSDSKELQELEPSGNQLLVTSVTSEITQQELNAVKDAIALSMSDTVIIKEVLGYAGRNFAIGKERLAAIKKQLG